MREALADAQLGPGDVDYINAHGTSTGAGDLNEILAIRRVFGDHATGRMRVSSTKSMTGHLLGAAGALETVICVMAMQRGSVPPTINLDNPIEEVAGMNMVAHQAQQADINVSLNNSFGFGGSNACLILRRWAS